MPLVATDISFSYGSRFALVHGSLAAAAGEFVGVIGANGSGKTTMLKVISGLLPRRSGTILLDGEPMEAFTVNRRARHLAFVPQMGAPVFEFTVEQTVLLGRMPYRASYGGFDSDDDLLAADEAIALLELDRLRHEPITRLSGGELQRVMIARAVAQGTGTIVLDEPTAHLDISHQQGVLEILRRRTTTHRTCIIASVHDLNLAAMFCDSIVVVAGGRTVCQGSPRDVLNTELLHRTFGIELDVEPAVYGDAPGIRYRFAQERGDEP